MSLGTNLGDRKNNLKRAIDFLRNIGIYIEKVSQIFETEPIGYRSFFLFYNMVLVGKTSLSPFSLMFEIKKIETLMGRPLVFDDSPYEDRIIDIDILFYENMIIDQTTLIVPHPQLHKRAFVMIPCLELLPDFIHPRFNKSLKQLFEENKVELFQQTVIKVGCL